MIDAELLADPACPWLRLGFPLQVLLPPAPQPAPVTIASVASSVPQLSTLVSLVSGVPSLLAAVTDPNTSVTVFAPTNDVSGTRFLPCRSLPQPLAHSTALLPDPKALPLGAATSFRQAHNWCWIAIDAARLATSDHHEPIPT